MKFFYLIVFFIASHVAFGQAKEFSVAGNLEPVYRHNYVHVDDSSFILVAKTVGNTSENNYVIKRMNINLDILWRNEFHLTKYQNIIEIDPFNNHLLLLINEHDTDQKINRLIARSYQYMDGSLIHADTIEQDTIHPWLEHPGKGSVKQDFISAVASIQDPTVITPLEYIYHSSFSPNKENLLVYRYDYSQRELFVEVDVFDKELKKIKEGRISIDNGFISYGLAVNNRAEIFIYKASKLGKIALIQFDLSTKEGKYIDLAVSGTKRDNITISQIDDDHIIVAKLLKRQNILSGISYSRFDFNQTKNEFTRQIDIPKEFKDKVNGLRGLSPGAKSDEYWKNYELTDFFIHPNGNLTFVVEDRNLKSQLFTYDPDAVEEKNNWNPKQAIIHAGPVLLFTFDSNDSLIASECIHKVQEIDATDGINTVSYLVDDKRSDVLRFSYMTAQKSLVMNQINYVEVSRENGKIVRSEILPNPEKLTKMKPYSFFIDQKGKSKFILVGRKGIIGKKIMITYYDL